MPTTVTRTIGTGGNYSTVQAWEDACPANLPTVDQIWRGKLKKQVFGSVSGQVVTIAGMTTDATRYVELMTEEGASFIDNGVATNALRYNSANGAAIEVNGTYGPGIFIGEGVKALLSRFQVANTTGGAAIRCENTGASPVVEVRQVIAQGLGSNNSVVALVGGSSFLANSLVVVTNSTGRAFTSDFNASAYNCTLARPGGDTSTAAAILSGYSNPTIRNCAIFGFASVNFEGAPTFTNCFTDVASPPAGCTQTAFSTTSGAQFESISADALDLRIKSGSSLRNTGQTDATFGTPSINGLARPAGAAYDVGAWEFAESAGPATAITLAGPSSGTVGAASSAFTVAANGTITGTITVTPSDGGDGGAFTPASVAISSGTPTATFTYTAANAGSPTATITVTNNGGLTNPAGIAYSATAPAATSLVVTVPDAAGLSGFSAAVLSTSTPTTGSTVIRTATGLTFNGSGVATIDIAGLGVSVGARRWVTLTNSTGDPAQSPAPVQAQGPVTAS